MKISLLFPGWRSELGFISHFVKKGARFPPLNLAYLAAIAQNRGHEVRIIDGEAENINLEEIVRQTEKFNPDLVGITSTTPFYHTAEKLARSLKEKSDAPIAIGGAHITILKEKVFSDCFDYGFIGEAENSWEEFLDRKELGGDVSDVKGIFYREKGDVKFNERHEPIRNLDSIPLPARELLKPDLYKIGTLDGIKRFTTMLTMRGCPFKCIFCNTEIFGNDTKRRNPEKVVKEMKEVKEKDGVEHFFFLDDTLTLNKEHVLNLCNYIKKENLNITWEGATRANLVDEEVISKMAESGLVRLSFGLESVNENIRKTMKKQVPLESYATANKLTNKYGIETLNSCMIGLPGETEETVRETLRYLRQSKEIKQSNLTIAVPYPGTKLYEYATKEMHGLRLATNDFSKFKRYNSATMYVGDFSPKDLVDIQNEAIASIYLVPRRWKPMIKKFGWLGAAFTFGRLTKSVAKGSRFLTNKQLGIK